MAGPEAGWKRDEKALREAREQLRQYFAGERRVFDVPLRMAGTPFQRMVWQGLLEIPFGATWSYAELARHVGRPGASRRSGPPMDAIRSESWFLATASSALMGP